MPNVTNPTPGQPGYIAPVSQSGTYYNTVPQGSFNTQAGIVQPQYESAVDASGQLKSPFSYDPTQSSAFNQEASMASSGQLSPWAQLQQQQLGLSTQQQKDASAAQSLGSTDQAIQQAQTIGGGLGSGGAQQLATQGARSNIMAQQNIGSQSEQQNLGIQQADASNMQAMLGQVANTQTGALAGNAQTANQDLQNSNLFNSNAYNTQMSAWGAQQTANAQRSAANSSKK